MSNQAAFKTAQEDSRKLKAKPSNDELLDLYALFKVGEGKDIASEEAPGMFDLKVSLHLPVLYFLILQKGKTSEEGENADKKQQGKAKRRAWQKLCDEGVSEADAQQRYIDLVGKLKEQYGFDPEKVPETVGAN